MRNCCKKIDLRIQNDSMFIITELRMKQTTNYTIEKLRIVPMSNFVSEVLDKHQAQHFYLKHKKTLNGNYVYQFQITKPNISWTLHKRLFDFNELVQKLNLKIGKPMFVFSPEANLPDDTLFEQLRAFLQNMVQPQNMNALIEEFLEDSNHQYEGLQKYKEMYMYKRAGGRYQQSCMKCGALFKSWKIRHFIIHNQGIIYKDEHGNIKQYISYDFDFKMKHGKAETQSSKGVILQTSHRKLTLQALNHFDYLQFVLHVKQGIKKSEYTAGHRYNSFAPVRKNCQIEFFVDGEGYYRDLAMAMLAARKQIFIAGWWVSPQFHLVRPVNQENQKYRLDRVIQRAAKNGVKVSIIVYFQSKMLQNDSEFTKKTLQKLSPNVKVLRHPSTVLPFLWSHHQKMVIIDQQIAFTGGLDLCYARYDTSAHLLFDYSDDMFPGIDYNNIRRKDIVSVKNFESQQYPKTQPRLPWHDIACKVFGEVVWDLSLHFIQYWNYASHQIQLNNRNVLVRQARTPVQRMRRKLDEGINKVRQFTHKVKDRILKKEEEPNRFQLYYEDLRERGSIQPIPSLRVPTVPRPSKNLFSNSTYLTPQEPEASDARRSMSVISVPEETFPHTEIKCIDERYVKILGAVNSELMHQQKKEDQVDIGEVDEQEIEEFQMSFFNPRVKKQALVFRHKNGQTGRVECQVVRSVSAWSIGCSEQAQQFSIQIAYIQLIALSKHYIYIQNQFFISSCADQKNIKNQICNALVQRIIQAHERNQPFKVYVMLPLLPGFAGEVSSPDSTIMKLNLHWEYQTICRSSTSMIEQLKKTVGDWQKYIQFLSVRTHGKLTEDSVPVTEIVYIHSKLMIVDDETVIVGSANINDRSMIGKRDSEVCVISKDSQIVHAFINKQQKPVRRAAHDLRCKLFRQHFGIKDPKQLDPVSDQTWNFIKKIAKTNTEIYRTVFACYPDDNIVRVQQIPGFKREAQLDKYAELTCCIRANVVEFPLHFLQEEDLNVKMTQKQYILPITLAL